MISGKKVKARIRRFELLTARVLTTVHQHLWFTHIIASDEARALVALGPDAAPRLGKHLRRLLQSKFQSPYLPEIKEELAIFWSLVLEWMCVEHRLPFTDQQKAYALQNMANSIEPESWIPWSESLKNQTSMRATA